MNTKYRTGLQRFKERYPLWYADKRRDVFCKKILIEFYQENLEIFNVGALVVSTVRQSEYGIDDKVCNLNQRSKR